ncbi:hypothetical protein B0T26DRAFT_695152 [Lasiosphaeria miniovina]|uniref:Uncharacterized protein n=1 Tax=Lasiosphaeria miniovina TaxID=1954250 RepID=A0AA40B4M0_9PEZI|nr:uncharacterized protein B0T26DRAFT_695152 [Lasiosphaeria miniovina]KAK0727606.1 hypothetical protein B0T26DRAFT_695152 [Lasiosphaeria miniovina]
MLVSEETTGMAEGEEDELACVLEAEGVELPTEMELGLVGTSVLLDSTELLDFTELLDSTELLDPTELLDSRELLGMLTRPLPVDSEAVLETEMAGVSMELIVSEEPTVSEEMTVSEELAVVLGMVRLNTVSEDAVPRMEVEEMPRSGVLLHEPSITVTVDTRVLVTVTETAESYPGPYSCWGRPRSGGGIARAKASLGVC